MTVSGPHEPPSVPDEHDDAVGAAIVQAGPPGVDLIDLEQQTGLRKRVWGNVLYRLERQSRAYCVARRPRLRYAAKRWRPEQ